MPWELRNKKDLIQPDLLFWEIRAPGKDGACSYQHGGFSFTVCTTLENARMLAAAPDLVGALRKIASCESCDTEAADIARAALAKATGDA